jgi:hypothetical protein
MIIGGGGLNLNCRTRTNSINFSRQAAVPSLGRPLILSGLSLIARLHRLPAILFLLSKPELACGNFLRSVRTVPRGREMRKSWKQCHCARDMDSPAEAAILNMNGTPTFVHAEFLELLR